MTANLVKTKICNPWFTGSNLTSGRPVFLLRGLQQALHSKLLVWVRIAAVKDGGSNQCGIKSEEHSNVVRLILFYEKSCRVSAGDV